MDSCTLRNDHQTFSYGGLPPEQVQELRAIADTLKPLLGSLLLAALQAGRELRAAKKILRHGRFGEFCRTVLNTDVRMCQYYINVADLADDIGEDRVRRMSTSAAIALSSASPDVVSRVVKEMKDEGECPSVSKIKQLIRESRVGACTAAGSREVDRLPDIARLLTMRLQPHELADLAEFLRVADPAAVLALCDMMKVAAAASD